MPAARGAAQNAALFAPLRVFAAYLGFVPPSLPAPPLRQVRLATAPGGIGTRAVFTVTLASDEPDFSTTDGVCDTNLTTPGDNCTLRAAIQQANALAGADTIAFGISGTPGVAQTIAPAFVPQLISRFMALHPAASVSMAEGTQDELFRGLMEFDGTLDGVD